VICPIGDVFPISTDELDNMVRGIQNTFRGCEDDEGYLLARGHRLPHEIVADALR
jgi:hypothetical protein